jgi:hypothetical protein
MELLFELRVIVGGTVIFDCRNEAIDTHFLAGGRRS